MKTSRRASQLSFSVIWAMRVRSSTGNAGALSLLQPATTDAGGFAAASSGSALQLLCTVAPLSHHHGDIALAVTTEAIN